MIYSRPNWYGADSTGALIASRFLGMLVFLCLVSCAGAAGGRSDLEDARGAEEAGQMTVELFVQDAGGGHDSVPKPGPEHPSRADEVPESPKPGAGGNKQGGSRGASDEVGNSPNPGGRRSAQQESRETGSRIQPKPYEDVKEAD